MRRKCPTCNGSGTVRQTENERWPSGTQPYLKPVECPACEGAGSVEDPDDQMTASKTPKGWEPELIAAAKALAKEERGSTRRWPDYIWMASAALRAADEVRARKEAAG